MDALLQTGIGVAVSLALFLIGYRQTVGAKKERVRFANASLRRGLLRRVVLEEYEPNQNDLRLLIEGKAREFRVSPDDLLSEEQFLTDTYAEVFESDVIDPAARSGIERRLIGALQNLRPFTSRMEQFLESKSTANQIFRLLLPLVLVATILGTMVSLVPQIRTGSLLTGKTLELALTVAVASVTLMTALLTFRRQRDLLVVGRAAPTASARFEAGVAQALSELRVLLHMGVRTRSAEADFAAIVGDRRIAIEAKAWRGPVPAAAVIAALRQLTWILDDGAAQEAILVVPDDAGLPPATPEDDRIHILKFSQLAPWIRERGPRAA